jgi:hypothetical protein
MPLKSNYTLGIYVFMLFLISHIQIRHSSLIAWHLPSSVHVSSLSPELLIGSEI